MGWSGYQLRIGVCVDAHGGEREQRGEAAYEQFKTELAALCEDERFNNDDIQIIF